MALKVIKTNGYLNIQATITGKLMKNNTAGLLGVYNDDKEDDLTAPDGSKLDIHTASESDIYHQFGEKCKLSNVSTEMCTS